MEWDTDSRMRRTAQRPIPAGRFGFVHATLIGVLMTLGGALYLGLALNPLTAWLALATSAVYLGAYTPLKKVHPICTLVGAFPGAMPGVLGWTAARGRLEWGALVMFAIVFFWQFPHFYSIAWLYRQDYEDGGIRMLPVVESDGKSTGRQILIYSLALIPISLLPAFLGMSGKLYLAGALLLGIALLYVGWRLATLKVAPTTARSKQRARQLLQATVIYLPLLFALMIAQLCLGFVAFLTRVAWGHDAVQPELPMVVSTVAHVAVGALLLATTAVLAVQAWRHSPVAVREHIRERKPVAA
jgi:protoheme IX farnesyltransferase